MPPPGLGEDGLERAVERFMDEARAVARFDHPAVVRVLDVFPDRGTAYLVMPLMRGETLGDALDRTGPLPPAAALEVARGLAGALDVVRARGLLHRDIKPDNVFLAESGPVLIDFGAARAFVDGRAVRHTTILTHGYAPLEQLRASSRLGRPPTCTRSRRRCITSCRGPDRRARPSG